MKKHVLTILLGLWAIVATIFSVVQTKNANDQEKLARAANEELSQMKNRVTEQNVLADKRLLEAQKLADELRKQKEQEENLARKK